MLLWREQWPQERHVACVWVQLELAAALMVKLMGEIDILHTYYTRFIVHGLPAVANLGSLYSLQLLDCR